MRSNHSRPRGQRPARRGRDAGQLVQPPDIPGPLTLPPAAVTRWSRSTGYGRYGPRSALVIFQRGTSLRYLQGQALPGQAVL
jgi:hypothetical protein